MLTDIPIGAWTLTILLDLIGLLFGFPQLGLASSISACIGVAGVLAAAAAGLADWMDVDPPEKAIGAFHASVNVSATILFLISFLMRWGSGWQLGWATFVVAPGNDRRLPGRGHGVLQGGHDQPQCIPNWSG